MNATPELSAYCHQAIILIRLYGPRCMRFSDLILDELIAREYIGNKKRPYQLTNIGRAFADKKIADALHALSLRS